MSWLPSVTWAVSPMLLQGEGFRVSWFNVLWPAEMLLGYWLLSRQVRRGGGDEEEAADLAVYAWLGLVAGARLAQGLFYDLDTTLADPLWLLRLKGQGGLASHGAVLGVLGAAYLFAKRRGMSILEVTDRLVYSAALSAIVHRLANLFNSEIVGRPTDGSWGVRFPWFDRGFDVPLRHPTQLYEAAFGVLVLGVLYVCDRRLGKEARPRGALTGVLLVTYFTGRFLIEVVKEPQGEMVWLLNMGQLLSVPFMAAGIAVLWRSSRRRVKAGWLSEA